MAKIIVNYAGDVTDDKRKSLTKKMADLLAVLEEDIIILSNVTISVVEIPAEMTKARAAKDKEDAAAAEKAAHEKEKAEKAAAAAAAKAEKAEAKAHAHDNA